MSTPMPPAEPAPPVPTVALQEPTRRVNGLFLGTLALANLGIMLAFYTPIQNLLPRMSEEISGADGKEFALAVVTGVGVLGSVVGNPLAGALSDRTTSRFGRRRPWLLGGAIVGAIAVSLLTLQSTVLGLAITWLFAQVSVNSAYAALTATIPDQVPVNQRGVASGWVGLAQTLGIVLGVALVSFVVTGLAAGHYLTSALLLLLVLPFLAVLKDPVLPREDREPFHLGRFVKGFWVSPRLYPDFAWAWGARFLVQLGSAIATLYLLFFLKDRIGLDDTAAQQNQTILIGLYAFGTMATAVVGGYFSDRSGRRKIFVIEATVVMAVAAVILAFTTTIGPAFVAALILGLGYGWYLAVDQALITQVLPAARDRARDLGVINIANSAPQVLAPVIALAALTVFGRDDFGYPALYIVTAIVTLLGAVAIVPIKSVP
ncbi:MAG: MFS transporter [Candidatus Nanopelagicales bacterium]